MPQTAQCYTCRYWKLQEVLLMEIIPFGKQWKCTYPGPKGFRGKMCMMYKEANNGDA